MAVLFENDRQARKTRKAIVAAVVWAVGWFYWAMVMAHFFGALPGSEADPRPGLAALMFLVGVAPFAGLLFYSRVYLVRIERDQDLVALTTLGVFSPRVYQVPQSAIVSTRTQTDDRNNTGAGRPVWITIRVAGRRLPFVADMQAERVDAAAIRALA